MAWLGTWAYRREITIDHTKIDSNLTHFPIPIVIGTSVGIGSADVSDIFDEVGSSYLKIAITKGDGQTEIYADVEMWDDTAEEAVIWVSKSDLTLLASADTVLYLYYDSTKADNTTYIGASGSSAAQNVWDSYYEFVFHMSQDPSGGSDCMKDSTSNGRHGTPAGSMTSGDLVSGMIGKGLEFDGSDDRVQVVGYKGVGGAADRTIEVVMSKTSTNGRILLAYGKASNGQKWNYRINSTSAKQRTEVDGGYVIGSTSLSASTFYLLAAVFSGSNITDILHYVNASLDSVGGSSSESVNTDVSTNDVFIGYSPTGSAYYWAGVISEVRLSSIARPAAWIKADSYGLDDNLVTWGTVETEPSEETMLEDLSLDLAVFHQKLDFLLMILQAHDGLEFRDYKMMLEAHDGLEFRDYKMILEAFNIKLEDFLLDLEAYYQKMEPFEMDLEAFRQKYAFLQMILETLGENRVSFQMLLHAIKVKLKSFPMLLEVVNGTALRDFAILLEATDGTILSNFTLHLSAIKAAPEFRCATAQRLSSVLYEVS